SWGVRGEPLGGRDVLVQPEEVVRVVAALERLQLVVLRRAVRIADPLLALFHQEVDVHARVVRPARGAERPRPLALLVEALWAGGRTRDVERVSCAAAVERGLVLADAGDRAALLPDLD